MVNAASRSSGANIAPVSIVRTLLSVASIAWSVGAAVAQPAAGALAPLAHSSQLTVDAAPVPGGLGLRVQRAGSQTPPAVSDVAVMIDGRTEPASARPDGSWFLARPPGAQDPGKTIAVTVGHDGIHEVLSGRLAAPAGAAAAARSAASTVISSSHKQLFWWILNIGIVLIAAIAISRRTS